MKVKAAVVRERGQPFVFEELELSAPQADEVLVEIRAVGLCHTDLAVRDGSLPVDYPIVLGHEGSGVVREVGPGVTRLKAGDSVVLTFPSCGHCTNCTRDDTTYCENGFGLMYAGRRVDGSPTLTDADGPVGGAFFGQSSFATFALASERNAVKVPDGTDLALAAPLGCGVQTGAGTVLNALEAQPGRALAVFGGGAVGLSAALAGVMRGCKPVIVVEPVAARRELALELGVHHAINPKAGPVAEAIRAIVARGVDYAVDTTANVEVLKAAMASLALHGRIAWLGVPHDPAQEISLSVLGVLAGGVVLRAVIEGDSRPHAFIPELLQQNAAGAFPFDRMVKTYPFEQINQAVEDQLAGRCLKPVLLMPAA